MLSREEIHKNIKRLVRRKESRIGGKVTAVEVAEAAGITADYARKILKGDRIGSPMVLAGLARYLDCSIDDIVMPKNKTLS